MNSVNPLRQSVAEWCFFRNQPDPAAYYRRLRDIGFVGVEMVDPSRYAMARAAGLQLVNATGTRKHGGLNRTEEHPQALAEIRESLATARECGIAHLIVFAGQRAGQPDEQGIRNCISGLKQVATEAEKARVTLVFEVFNKFDHPDYQADYSDYAFQVVRAVASPSVKVLYDIYHMHRMGENVADVIARNVSYIAHLHVAGSPKRDFPGPRQEIDYRRVVQAVMAAGYDGLWGQEFVPQADPLAELAEVFILFESYASFS